MNRWSLMPSTGMVLLCLTASFTSFTSLQAHAQAGLPEPRQFAPGALRGVMVVTAPPEVLLDSQPARLAPAARIRNIQNLDVLSGTLVNQPVVVNYTRDNMGQLREVWILTSEEATEKRSSKANAPSVPLLRYDQLPAFK